MACLCPFGECVWPFFLSVGQGEHGLGLRVLAYPQANLQAWIGVFHEERGSEMTG